MDSRPIAGIVAPTPGSDESESGHIATYMIVSVMLQFHDEVHVFTRATAVMEFNHTDVTLHTIQKPFADSAWYLRLPGQFIYQLRYCASFVSLRRRLDLVLFGGSGFLFPMATARGLGFFILYRIGGVIHYQESETNASLLAAYWSRFLETVQSLLYLLADEILVISPTLIEFAELGAYEDKISVWCHYYFDLDTFGIKRRFEERDPVIGQVGIVSEIKGSLQFIEAMGAVTEEREASMVIVGDGPLLSTAKTRAEELNIAAEFTDRIPRDEVPDRMNGMRILVISSVTEGVPKVALEAMACGTVPLATSVGGIPDFIDHGETGYLIEDNNPETIADAVLELLDDDLSQMSRNARAYVENNFSYGSSVRQYGEVLATATPFDSVEPPANPDEPLTVDR
jgi:glycosyltransferase involved in cell wall biosynthesis